MSFRSDVIVGEAVSALVNDAYTKAFSVARDQRAENTTASLSADADVRYSASPDWISAAISTGADVVAIRTTSDDVKCAAFAFLQKAIRRFPVTVLEPVGAPVVDLYHPLIVHQSTSDGEGFGPDFLSASQSIADGLIQAAARHAATSGRLAAVRFGQVPLDSPLQRAAAVASQTNHARNSIGRFSFLSPRIRLRAGTGVPVLFIGAKSYEEAVSAKQRRAAKSKLRSFQSDFPGSAHVHALAAEAGPWLQRIEELRVARDRATNRGRELEIGPSGALWKRYLASVIDRLEVFALTTPDQLVSFNLVLRDGNVSRVVDGRISADFVPRGVGRVTHQSLTEAAFNDPTVHAVEWGRGEQSYKSHVTTDVIATAEIVWFSNWFAEVAYSAPSRVKGLLKTQLARFAGADALARQVIDAVRQAKGSRR